jgi:hypothetical protein
MCAGSGRVSQRFVIVYGRVRGGIEAFAVYAVALERGRAGERSKERGIEGRRLRERKSSGKTTAR